MSGSFEDISNNLSGSCTLSSENVISSVIGSISLRIGNSISYSANDVSARAIAAAASAIYIISKARSTTRVVTILSKILTASDERLMSTNSVMMSRGPVVARARAALRAATVVAVTAASLVAA